MFNKYRSDKSKFIDRERFGKYLIAENLNRILWSALALAKLLMGQGFEAWFPLIILIGALHLLLSIIILTYRRIGKTLFFSYPLIISLIDIAYMTFIISYTGLADSYMCLLYIFPITFWGLRYGVKGSLTIASIISILYLAICYGNLGSIPLTIIMRITFFLHLSLYLGFLCEKTQNKIYNMATLDRLTSLYNQKYFYDNLTYVLGQASQDNRPVSLALLDLDNFKEHNDQLGHLKGDQLLQRVSTLIKNNIRSTDTAARYGGDEFVIIFPNTNSKSAIQISERIRQSIEQGIGIPNVTPLSVSIGIAVFPEDGTTPFDLFNAADKSLYLAKNQGKNTVVYQSNTADRKSVV